MYTWKELRKLAKTEIAAEDPAVRVALLGNCSTQFLKTALEGYAKAEKQNIRIWEADYDQIEIQLFDSGSELFAFAPQRILLWLAAEKLYEEFLSLSFEERDSFADNYIVKIKQYWDQIMTHSAALILQMNFTEIDDKVLGQYSAKVDKTFIYQIRKLNWLLEEAMREQSNVYPVDLLAVQIRMGQSAFFDAALYYNAKMCISTTALPYVAKAVTDVLQALEGRIKKCIVMDLDNTLWGGIIGDDGMEHIEIGELGRGPAFTGFQRWLKQLKEYGIILAVCSKNEEQTAREPFEKHPDMVLKLSDISVFVANWEDKASDIRLIQESLNIGFDSMIFLDDNPFERNLVRQRLPEVKVPELPEDPAKYLDYLQACNYFENVSFTGRKEDRTGLYQAEFERKKAEKQYDTIDDYLKSLDMAATVRHFETQDHARIAQLTQRSNQFNVRTVRYTENEIMQIAKSSDWIPLSFSLKDRYGDHGLIGLLFLRKKGEKELFIENWLMSCRVLKRGMEEFMLNKAVEAALSEGFEMITGQYIPTPKNRMVASLYPQMGFKQSSEGKYSLDLLTYQPKKTYMKEG
ncbi:MAG: HAD-IIIC family phosphatase [Lachnospiraceae bacterium]|nr:HAD-IIIC family phosphatase [Lachnospiraceae bacterium]